MKMSAKQVGEPSPEERPHQKFFPYKQFDPYKDFIQTKVTRAESDGGASGNYENDKGIQVGFFWMRCR